jgi:hypothetical protein
MIDCSTYVDQITSAAAIVIACSVLNIASWMVLIRMTVKLRHQMARRKDGSNG